MAVDAQVTHAWLSVVVGRVVDAAAHTKIFELLPEAGQRLPGFEAGAHIAVQCGGLVRHYSLFGPRKDPALYRIAVKLEEGGRGGSRWMFEHAKSGAKLLVSAPRNNFPLVPAANFVFVAGGIGLTPILSMLGALGEAGVRARLIYLCRSPVDFAFAQELEEQKANHDVVVHFDSTAGALYDVVGDLTRRQATTEVYCCGPLPLMKAVREVAEASDESTRFHFEYFTAEPAPLSVSVLDEFDVFAQRSGKTIRVHSGESVLAALRREGFPLESECEEGVCGTCMVRVLSGLPDHRDYVLTEQERAQNTQMMTCVSRAKTSMLVLDL